MIAFAKGHGTRNDFVLLADPDDGWRLSEADVRFLCDRRGGIGADGVLRAVPAARVPEWDGDRDLWFMDYRNADGSIAEMCGNGLRVFARFLVEEGLVPAGAQGLTVATRAGVREAELLGDGRVRVSMGRPTCADAPTAVGVGDVCWPAVPVDVGNPHAVVLLAADDDLAGLDLAAPPRWDPPERFPDGVNVEFVQAEDDHHLRMRVHERGVGETQSCGTGTVAAAAAAAAASGRLEGTWRVDVPGGTVEVELQGGVAWLTGPAEIVARGRVSLPRRLAG